MVDVVILSCSEDEELVRPVAEQAASLGLELWRSNLTSDLEASGEDNCKARIGRAGAVLVCWSDHAVASKLVSAAASDALWQQKLVACRLSPCNIPSPFDSIPAAELTGWAGRIGTPAWNEIIAATVEKLRRSGLLELLRARISGDESVLYSFATRFPDEPEARKVWAVFEEKYREECASAIRDGRSYLEQRAASQQRKIEHTLKSFAEDFQIWLERERRGEASPKPSLETLLDIWLRGGPPQQPEVGGVFNSSESHAEADGRQTQLNRERQCTEETAKAALARAELAEAELAETRTKLNELKSPPPTAAAVDKPRPVWKRMVLAGATLLAFGLGLLLSPIFDRGRTTSQSPESARTSRPTTTSTANEPSSRAVAPETVQKSVAEILEELLEAHRDETIARVIGFDPQAALAKLLDIAPEDTVKASASKMPSLAVSEALKSSVPQAMAPVAQLSPPDLFQALQAALPPSTVSKLAKLLAEPAQPSALPTPVTYTTYDNLDIESKDVTKLKIADLQNCSSACRQKEGCKAYTFDKWNRVCYLKYNLGTLKLNPRSLSGIRADVSAPPNSAAKIIIEHYHMKAFPGQGYNDSKVDRPETCELYCMHDKVCVVYTFYFNQMLCRMFSSAGEYFSDNASESGGKRQE